VAFGKDDALYRLSCDDHVYKQELNKWEKLGFHKAWMIAGSKDGLWISDQQSGMAFKFDETMKLF
jgi:hypothetical protein